MNIEQNSKKEQDKIIYKPNNKNNKIGNYEIIKTLGEGTFGKVKLAIHIPTNEKVAIKILEKSRIEDNEDLQCINREITFLKTLNHINIISLYEIIENSEYYYIIMEYAENDLFTFIVQNNFLSEETASLFYYQIIKVIEYIHKYKIVHRDLKPENILLTNNNTIIKIIDFGLANSYKKENENNIEKNLENNNNQINENNNNNIDNIINNNNENLLNTLCGSPCYAAPEMILGKKYNGLNIDIWSSGIILFAMVCGYLPFEDDDNEIIYRKIILGKFEIPDRLSNNCKDLIYKILEINPKKRIKINEILKHPFLKFCDEKFNKIISPYGIYYNNNCYIYNSIIDKIIDMKIINCDNKNEIIENIKKNNFNQITTLYKILFKKAIKNNEINSKNNIIINNNIDCCASLSSCKTCASNNTKNDNNKLNKDKNSTPEINNKNNSNNNFSNYNKFKNNINLDALDKLIKIHSLNENKLNNLKKKKINFLNNNNNNNNNYKTKRTFMKNYEDLMNNVKKILSNRNGRNENSSSSVELNLHFNKTDSNNIKGKKNNFLSSSNIRVNTIRFSADAPRNIFFQDTQKDEYIVNEKTKRKKPLSIITNGNNFIDSYDNLIMNTDYNVNSKLNKLEKLDDNIKKLKKVISGICSPKLYSIKTCNNNNSLKKKNVNFNYKNINNNNMIKSKNKFIQKGKLYTKTVSVINHLNLICNTTNNINNKNNNNINIKINNNNNNYSNNNNKSIKKNRKSKNSVDLKKLNLNFRELTNCRILLKTFIDNTNSKSPFNIKSNKNQNIKNLTKNTTPSNRNCTFTFKEKPSPKNLEDKYFKNKKFEKNKENKNENLNFLSNIIKKDFICFSTKLSLDDIFTKIKNFFNKVKYKTTKKDKNHFDIYNKNIHFISIEISKVEENNIVNIYHILDNKTQSKNIIKNLIAEIGF